MQPVVAQTYKVDSRIDPRQERTRQAVLAAAIELLGEGGLEAATVNAVATRAGVNKTTIYRNWPDGTGFVYESLAELAYAPPNPDLGDLRADLCSLFTGLALAMQRPPWDKLLPSLLASSSHNEHTARFHANLVRGRRDAAVQLIKRDQQRTGEQLSMAPRDLVESIAATIFYRVLMTKETVTKGDVGRLIDRALQEQRPPNNG
jgi:AcrR family transcriptional regulator